MGISRAATHPLRNGVGCTPGWAAIEWSIGKASFQQPYDLFFATLAVIVSTTPIVDSVRFIPQETVDKNVGPLGFDEGYKSPDS
jgi:hypothetical protein